MTHPLASALDATLRQIVREAMHETMREELPALLREALAEAAAAPATDSRVYLTTKEAAKMAGVSEGTIRTWISERTLPAVRVGRRFRIERRALDGYLAGCGDEGVDLEAHEREIFDKVRRRSSRSD